MTSIVNITQSALSKLAKIVKSTHNYAFLFSANSGGCNGFNYDLSTINKEEFDTLENSNILGFTNILEHEDIIFAVDPLAEIYLLGTTIDYIKEDYSKNIFESKFVFIPDKNIATTCGCGVSFNPK
jgi:iron-sulfur cluster assembly protein